MKIVSVRIAGFARLAERTFEFAPGLCVVFGPNESGKSTLANAIVATLYGPDRRRDAWRPWSGGAYATTLTYDLANGERIEVQREYDRDAKGVRVYDRSGNDLAAKVGQGRKLVPGEAHLGIPLDVFLNAACVKQQSIAIDEGRDAAPIAAHLARALDGGPKEDAAIGAVKRLDDALKLHVGGARATKNAPLRAARDRADAQARAIADVRSRRDALDDVRARIERATIDHERWSVAAIEIDRRARAVRAGAIAKRLVALREFREELAELHAARALFDDVATFDAGGEAALGEAYVAWEFADRAAASARSEADAARLGPSERSELDARRADAGSFDDDAFAALTDAAANADRARLAASSAATEAALARRTGEGAKDILGGVLAIGIAVLCVAIGFAIAHEWIVTTLAVVVAIVLLGISYAQGRSRGERRRDGERKQQLADAALNAEARAASAVAAVIDPLGIASIDELARRRERLAALTARTEAASASAARAVERAAEAATAAARFDRLAAALVPDISGDRPGLRAAVAVRATRKRERDGVEAHVNALELRKSTILGSDDAYALETELAELVRDGVEPATDDPTTLRVIEAERAEIAAAARAAGEARSRLHGELAAAESHVADLATMDEELERTRAEIARIERFERAVQLARTILEERTQEAHRAFARRLEDYAARTLGGITNGRYDEIFVDPATLGVRVRVPETQAIVDLDALSAGTRDQAYLVVRFAMARMFAEGIEPAPLLLDDPFAFWDTARIARCLPLVAQAAAETQTIVFTSSAELAAAAVAAGAHRIDLPPPHGHENSASAEPQLRLG